MWILAFHESDFPDMGSSTDAMATTGVPELEPVPDPSRSGGAGAADSHGTARDGDPGWTDVGDRRTGLDGEHGPTTVVR